MELWLDTINFEIISQAESMGILDGVTTNPTILASSHIPLKEIINTLLDIQSGPVVLQVLSDEFNEMMQEAEYYYSQSNRVIVKVPVTKVGLQVLSALAERHVPTVATTIFAPSQLLLAAKVGATYAAPYLGRMDLAGENSFELLDSMINILKNYAFDTKILAASLKTPYQAIRCAEMGVHAITLKSNVYREFVEDNIFTLECLDQFQEDWKARTFARQ